MNLFMVAIWNYFLQEFIVNDCFGCTTGSTDE
jgi:hypothetical protein